MSLHAQQSPTSATGTRQESLVVGVALFATAPAELVSFYERVLRTAFMHRVHANGSEHWIAAQGGVQVEIKALTCADGSPTPDGAATREHGESGTSRAELSFQVDDVAAASARAVISGGRVLQRAETFSWGTFAVVLDPELNRIGLFTPPREQAQSPILEGEA